MTQNNRSAVAVLATAAALILAAVPVFADDTGSSTNVVPTQPAQPAQGAPPVQVPLISVTGVKPLIGLDQALQQDGTEAQGYRADVLSAVGPFSDRSLQDTPFSYSVMSQDFIQNTQAYDADTLFKYDPFTQPFQAQVGQGAFPQIRGFVNQTVAQDGLIQPNSHAISPLEEMERVEILNGAYGFLYGFEGLPGGVVNYVLKRPTPTPYESVTGGYWGGAGYGAVDVGGPLNNGMFGYRLNVAEQDGGANGIQGNSVTRHVLSGAFDWHIADNLLLQFNASYNYMREDFPQTFWIFNTGARIPSPPDVSKNFSQPWAYQQSEQEQGGTKLTWNINDALTFRAAANYSNGVQSDIGAFPFVSDSSGTYTGMAVAIAPAQDSGISAYGFVDAKFRTWTIDQKMTVGYSVNTFSQAIPTNFVVVDNLAGPFNFNNPIYVPNPGFPGLGGGPNYQDFFSAQNNFVVGDEIKLLPAVTALLGLSYATISEQNYSARDVLSSSYAKGAIAPSASLIYKPFPWLSTYATYIQGLENGGQASPTDTNANQLMPPNIATQYEVGAKATVGKLLLTAALFDINQAYSFDQVNANGSTTFVQRGRNDHKGVELGVFGKLTDDISIWGGITQMDPRVANDPTLSGKRPVFVSNTMAKIYAEYAIPGVHGLFLTGNAQYYSRQFFDSGNTQVQPAYLIGGIGARYETRIADTKTMFRFNVDNIANKSYWMSDGFEGTARTFWASMQVKF